MKIIREVGRLIKDRNKTAEEKKVSRILMEDTEDIAGKVKAQQKIIQCRVQLETCDEEFCEVIESERELIAEKEKLSLPAGDSRNRIRQAALGRLVIRSALIDLKNSTSENRVNRAMDQLGESLRRLYNIRGKDIGKRNRDAICAMLPGAANVEEVLAKIEQENKYTVPPELNALVDENLVDDLISGEDWERCLELGTVRREKKAEETDSSIHLLNGTENDEQKPSEAVMTRSEETMKDVKKFSEILREKGNEG